MPRGLLLPLGGNRFQPPRGQHPQTAGLDVWYPVQVDHENTFWHNALLVGSGSTLNSATRAFRPDLGLGYSFDGSSSRGLALNNGSTPETAAWTLTAWLILTSTTSTSGVAIIGHLSGDTSAGSWSTLLGYRSAVLDGYFYNGTAQHCTGTTTLATSTLYHVAFTGDTAANSYKVYLNGVDDTAAAPSTTTAPSLAVNRLAISATTNNNTGNNGFQNRVAGVLGDLRRYKRALSPQEIWQLWAPQTRWALYQPVRRFIAHPTATGRGTAGGQAAAATTPAHTGASVGSTTGQGQALTVSARTSTPTAQTGTHGQVIATSGAAMTTSAVGQGGVEGQSVTTMTTMTLVPGSLATLGAGI